MMLCAVGVLHGRNIRCDNVSGVFVVYTVMKQLLLLTFMVVASEAMAQDAQCVLERAAMVDTIRAYARSEAGALGPQGISERVLEAIEQTERHRLSASVLARPHTWTRRFSLAAGRQYRNRS